jgi:16S rRNA (uracil1498-N3)-methyltransferase
LDSAEAAHLTQVLRLTDGDTIEAMDGNGKAASGILHTSKRRSWVELNTSNIQEFERPLSKNIILYSALLKGDSMDWLIEKATELEVTEFQPLITEHTVVRIKGNRDPEEFRDRWQKVADQALKQCGRKHRLKMRTPLPIFEALTQTAEVPTAWLWLDESTRNEATTLTGWLKNQKDLPQNINILLGPEGGFSYAERDHLERMGMLKRVSLGPWVLRAETAGIHSCGLIMGEILWRTLNQKENHPKAD